MLSQAQIDQYHSQGYLVLENAIQKEDIERLKSAALEIVDNFDIESNRTVFKTNDRDSRSRRGGQRRQDGGGGL